jgi:hypothetical protein
MPQKEIVVYQGEPGRKPWLVDATGTTQPITGLVNTHNYNWDTSLLDWVAAQKNEFTVGGDLVVAGEMSVSNFPSDYAKDGTDITTPTAMPTGGVGIRGWLSAIWTKLNGTIGVSGTFWQATQPISVVSLPLPSGAATEAKQEGLIERIVFNTLKRLNVDSAGRLRVSAESVASHAVTLATLTNITNWGLSTATAKSQWESNVQFQSGFRRNLVISA